MTANVNITGRCNVCNAKTAEGRKNCNMHLNTRESSLGLARYIHKLESRIPSSRIPQIAEQFNVSITTVYNHLRREGFIANREWRCDRKW